MGGQPEIQHQSDIRNFSLDADVDMSFRKSAQQVLNRNSLGANQFVTGLFILARPEKSIIGRASECKQPRIGCQNLEIRSLYQASGCCQPLSEACSSGYTIRAARSAAKGSGFRVLSPSAIAVHHCGHFGQEVVTTSATVSQTEEERQSGTVSYCVQIYVPATASCFCNQKGGTIKEFRHPSSDTSRDCQPTNTSRVVILLANATVKHQLLLISATLVKTYRLSKVIAGSGGPSSGVTSAANIPICPFVLFVRYSLIQQRVERDVTTTDRRTGMCQEREQKMPCGHRYFTSREDGIPPNRGYVLGRFSVFAPTTHDPFVFDGYGYVGSSILKSCRLCMSMWVNSSTFTEMGVDRPRKVWIGVDKLGDESPVGFLLPAECIKVLKYSREDGGIGHVRLNRPRVSGILPGGHVHVKWALFTAAADISETTQEK
ncbi:hypothetical protein Bbelb_201670 [Branchiostoma belcheri]|nr:hypothetical protein Bbelb_201670 [Branchiostoma belcheri]